MTSRGFGYVVVADAIQSGWTASVDGKRLPIRVADRGLADAVRAHKEILEPGAAGKIVLTC